jgi:glycosyltransferase involved in cell wall biosynthesis
MISILLATRNGSRYIKKSIDSIIEQSYLEWELLVGINDTTDSTLETLQQYNDARIKIYEYVEAGKSRTLNKLILNAKFDWVAIQDDDDIWIDTKLEKQVNYIDDYDVIGTFIKYIDKDDNIIGHPTLASCHNDIVRLSTSGVNQIANSSSLIKKSAALEIGGWKQELDDIKSQPCEDYDMWLKLMKKDKKFINIPEQLVLHRLHSNSNFNTRKLDLNKIL